MQCLCSDMLSLQYERERNRVFETDNEVLQMCCALLLWCRCVPLNMLNVYLCHNVVIVVVQCECDTTVTASVATSGECVAVKTATFVEIDIKRNVYRSWVILCD